MGAGSDNRIDACFARLKSQGYAGLVTFITAGDPDFETSMGIATRLAGAGADIIELGMPFSDPMADGPTIQLSSLRALRAGHTMKKTFAIARAIRKNDDLTPIVLMGYFNPIYQYGVDAFMAQARDSGVDGIICVDTPAEQDPDCCLPAIAHGIRFIRLVTPTSDDARVSLILNNAGGFLYYVAIAGITGTRQAKIEDTAAAIARLRKLTDLPLAVGFGIRTPQNVVDIGQFADAAVVGSSIVERIADAHADGWPSVRTIEDTLQFVEQLAGGLRQPKQTIG